MRWILGFVCAGLLVASGAAAKPPLWDKLINGKGRFQVLKAFGEEAVLDKETGLVWERAPSGANPWPNSFQDCLQFTETGGRNGWRLPLAEELYSLVDPATGLLPEDHPFTVTADLYWTATSLATVDGSNSSNAFVVDLNPDAFLSFFQGKNTAHAVWCVRGPG